MVLSSSNAAARAALDARLAPLNSGAAANPKVRIYTAPVPTRVDDGVGAATLLAELDMDGTAAFAAATDDSGNNRALAIANAIAGPVTALATGQAAFYLLIDKDGVAHVLGSAGDVGGESLVLNNATIQAGADVEVDDLRVYEPESSADV